MTRSASTKRTHTAPDSAPRGVEDATLKHIPIDRIDVPIRPARRFLGDIAALAETMRDYGLQQPISVRAAGNRFLVTSGMRRLAAARMLQWTSIIAFVRSVSGDDAYLLDLIENLQREDLSAEEEADAFGELIRTRGWTLQQVADSVKRSVPYVSKRVRVFEDPLLREAVAKQRLSVSTAEELLACDPEQRAGLIQRAVGERWEQEQARDALRPTAIQPDGLSEEHITPIGGRAGNDAMVRNRSKSRTTTGGPSSMHPGGVTLAIRDFHRLITDLRAEDLTLDDRAALRALFRDLVLLARPTTLTPRVFPARSTLRSG
jgi:ParB family chromosome partitioning protein